MHTQYGFIKEAHESWERDQRQMSCISLPNYTKPIPYLEQNWVVVWLCWPKTQLYKIVHCNNTSKISWVVHQKGAWVLGGESTADFLPNLDVTWRGQPIICINIEYVCGYFDQKYNYLCRIVHHQSTNKNSSLPLLPAHHPDPCGLLSLVAAWRQASCSITARTSGGAFYCSCHCPCAKVSQHSPYVDACFLLLFWFFCSLHIELLN